MTISSRFFSRTSSRRLGLVALAVSLAFSCKSEPVKHDAGSAGTGGAAPTAGRTGRAGDGPSQAGESQAGAGGLPDQMAPDGYWQPTGDPQWTAVDWAPGCLIERAQQPEHGMPDLTWEPCEGVAGCQLIKPTWYVKSQIYLGFAAGFRAGKQLRLAVGTEWGDNSEWRNAIYDESFRPLAVWRGAIDGCNGVAPRPTPLHTCFHSSKLGGGAVAGIFGNGDFAIPSRIYASKGRLNYGCSDSLVISFNTAGQSFIYDLTTEKETPLTVPDGEAFFPLPAGATAYFSRWSARDGAEVLDGWVWTKEMGRAAAARNGEVRGGCTLRWRDVGLASARHGHH